MIRWATAALIAVAQPASALSCMPYWIQDSWHEAVASEDRYVVVAGRFTFDPSVLPPFGKNEDLPEPVSFIAEFDADVLAGLPGQSRLKGEAELTLDCVAHWCAGIPQGPLLVFLRQTHDGWASWIGPCTGFIYADRPVNRAHVAACASGGTCVSAAEAMSQ